MSEQEYSLFLLIKSLTPSEKRHFSIYAARHTIGGKNNSVSMFKKLDALKEYDEHKFLRRNKKNDFAKYYSFNKNFLYKLILQSLHSFHEGKTVESEVREQLHYIDLLSEKGLFKQAEALLAAARKKTEKYQYHLLGLELLNREVELAREQSFSGKNEKDIERMRFEFAEKIKGLSSVSEMTTLNSLIFMKISKSGFARDSEVVDQLHTFRTNKKLKERPQEFLAAWHFYTARVRINSLIKNFKSAYEDNESLIDMIETNEHMIEEFPKYYILALHNKMVMLSDLLKYNEIPEVARKLEQVPVRTKILKNRKFGSSHNLLLQMYVKTGEFDKAVELLRASNEKINTGEVQFLNALHELTYYFAAANTHFGVADFSASTKYLQYIINRSDIDQRSDILCFALIMRIIVQFEMEKQDLLEYTVRSVYRFLHKRKRLYKFEDIVLRFIRNRVPGMNSKTEITKAFGKLKEELLPLTEDPFEKNAFAYFDMVSWLESKIYDRSFKDIIRSKFQKEKDNDQ